MIYYLYILYLMLIGLLLFSLAIYLLMMKMMFFLEFEVIKIQSIKIEILILLDWISVLFMSVVLLISCMVIFYSIEYMESEIYLERFMYLVMLFILSMMLMIISPNLISILMGWDGLGLVSYSLVVYYQNESSFNSGMVTVLTNRMGDIMILMMIGLSCSLGSWNFMFWEKLNIYLLFMLFLASITKSAQIPFSAWLPMAMAAPTPVSSLVHSSTLVTAGVYLLIRFSYLLKNSINLLMMMMMISVLTMFMAGLAANLEYDLKKIIAFSTLSQLGVMIFCLSIKLPEIAFYHLITHAMFKSMLFMCAGVIIHNLINNQDIRLIGMISFNFPLISMMFNCSTLSLMGMPFLSGFFSKDLILEMFMMNKFNMLIFLLLFMSMGLTVSYSIRLISYSFISIECEKNTFNLKFKSLNSLMMYSMLFLFFMSILLGVMMNWLMFSLKSMIFLPLKFKLMIYFFMMFGITLGVLFSNTLYCSKFLYKYNILIKFMLMLWFLPYLYSSILNLFFLFNLSLSSKLDLGWNEYISGMNLFYYIKKMFYLDLFSKNYFYLMIFIIYLMFILYLI